MKKIHTYTSMDTSKAIRLNANEISVNIYKDAIFSMTSVLSSVSFNRYPDDDATALREAYAKYAGVKEQNIIAGNGSNEMINLVINSVISNGKKLLTLEPDFSMFDFYTSMYGGEIVKVPVGEDGQVDIDEFIRKGKSEEVRIIIFSNPNNPTGTVIPENDMIRICREFKNIPVVVDEDSYEFCGESMVKYISEYENLLITRSLSKAWGLAAIRVGFLLGNEKKIKELSKYKPPYNLNSISQELAVIALGYPKLVKENAEIIIQEREKLFEELKKIEKESCMDISFYPSKANFIYGKTSYKEALINGLRNKNILIRTFGDNSFRITVGSSQENKRLIEALRKILVYEGENNYDYKDL